MGGLVHSTNLLAFKVIKKFDKKNRFFFKKKFKIKFSFFYFFFLIFQKFFTNFFFVFFFFEFLKKKKL